MVGRASIYSDVLAIKTDDGLCFIQPSVKQGAISGRASSTEISEAAYTMLQVCVVERGMGGIALKIGECPGTQAAPSALELASERIRYLDLFDSLISFFLSFFWKSESLSQTSLPLPGGDNNIDVVMAIYKPNVKCDPTSTAGPPWGSCVAVFASMRASKRIRVFGFQGDPNVEEELPLVLEGGK